MFSATRLQVATYLLGVCPFSIAFLVFLNSSVSFVVTDLIGQESKVGDAVGSLGFADELLALIACPVWGVVSDRIGVRWVCVLGYLIIALALVLFVQAKDVYPQLLLGRLLFSLGAAAASTMVTAVLPAVSSPDDKHATPAPDRSHNASGSVNSEATITQALYQSTGAGDSSQTASSYASSSRVAGLVGMLTGAGALIALTIFLPLPATFQKHGLGPGRALQHAFYIVAVVAFILSAWCFVGLRRLRFEEAQRENSTDGKNGITAKAKQTGYNLLQALRVGFSKPDIALGYTGGFVARASSVGISLFIPLLVNALFLSSHLCREETLEPPAGLPDIKRKCPRAYIVAAEMTGVCEMVALLAAPIFGYWSSRTKRRGLPMMAASLAGVIGYPLFATQFDPDDTLKGKRALAFVAVSLIGISQIGAIVCSLGVLSHGVLSSRRQSVKNIAQEYGHEGQPLLEESSAKPTSFESDLSRLKGSIAGIYSFYGGAAILILTKVGGSMFDKVDIGAPFYIMAAFNGILLVVSGVLGVYVTD
jgi:MFS family permease